ncbi:hypothetical protein IP86_13670 [Rhodopseudomonas sp. AAP120]|uniref:hypothetical protein n=1 Tax=Rhodopseudomonas sp. AAP120 TaxID=1523430 RepID=UPI0006B896FD|nr:hypothetical protein [Rhodopseudomonas sp. AAP120]KPF97602.1 hypothetical protein IP86_13670 [Rhodopseudomonas sp. AAP120]
MTRSPTRATSLLLIAAGFVIWASAFTLLYAALSVGCAFGWQARLIGEISLSRAVLLAIWAVHLAALVGLLIYCVRQPRGEATGGFIRKVAIGSTVAALVATVWTGVAIPAVSQCL